MLPGPVLVSVPVDVGAVAAGGVAVALAIAFFAVSPTVAGLGVDVVPFGEGLVLGLITGLWLTCWEPLGAWTIGALGLL
jgi:hypothetical protein